MMDRRTLVTLALGVVAAPSLVGRRAIAADGPASRMTAYVFSFKALSGPDIRLADFAGRPMMVVNTASLCGYTPQYAGLQALWREFASAVDLTLVSALQRILRTRVRSKTALKS